MSELLAGLNITELHESGSDLSWFRIQMHKRRRDLESIVRQVRVLTLVLKHPKAPWYAKAIAGCALAYLVSPVQLLPTFIPVIGQLDDLFVLFVGLKLLRKLTPPAILDECVAKGRFPKAVGHIPVLRIPRSNAQLTIP